MADDKIVIEIELDDGKIVRGFQKVESSTKKAGQAASGVGDQIEKAFGGTAIGQASNSINDFVSKIKSIHPALLLASAAIASIGVAFERALEGEKINALNQQFELLGNQAGVATASLRANLQAATGGAVDFEDVLKSTNKFLVEFGQNANRIPEVLDLSRKATTLFGGEVTDNFEKISQAIASGQTRSLKNLGIIIDQDKAYKDFAASIGVAAESLNEAGKKQAILEAVLAKGGETFKNVDPNVNQLATSISKLRVQLGDLFDEAATRSNETFGGFFASAINKTTELLERFNLATKAPQTGLAGLDDSIRSTEFKLQDVQKQIKFTMDEIEKAQTSGSGLKPTFNLGDLQSQKERLEKDLESMQMRYMKFQTDNTAVAKQEAEKRAEFVDQPKLAENLEKLKQQLLTAKLDRINAESQLDLNEDERVRIRDEQILLNQQMQDMKIKELTRLSREQGLIDTQVFEDLKTEIVNKGNIEREKIVSTYETQIAEKQKVASMQGAQAVSAAIQQTVMNITKGQNAFKAFGSAVLGLFGDILIEIGTSMLSIGYAMEAIRQSIIGMVGGPSIFAGIALIGLGTLLKSLSGGGASASATSGAGGGGGSSAPSTINEQPELERRAPQSQIAVNIQGDVLDSQDTGLRIVDMLRNFADKNGDVVTA